MAQFTALSADVTADLSADIAIPAAEIWHIGIFTTHADGFQAITRYQTVQVVINTPGTPTIVKTLHRGDPVVSIKGKSTVKVSRPAQPTDTQSAPIGAFYNTEA